MLRALIAAVAATILLTACTPSATPTASPPTDTAVPAPLTETETLVEPAKPTQPILIVYQRSGGFIGVKDSLTIDQGGHSTLMRRTNDVEFDLSRDELGAIQAAFDKAEFQAMPEEPTSQGYAADGFVYDIVYRGHEVKTGDPSVPRQLEPVVTLLNQLVDSKGK